MYNKKNHAAICPQISRVGIKLTVLENGNITDRAHNFRVDQDWNWDEDEDWSYASMTLSIFI